MSLNNELNNYVNMYNNNIAQINNLYYNNAILQNNIYLIRQRMTQIPHSYSYSNNLHNTNTNRPRARRRQRNTTTMPVVHAPLVQPITQPITQSITQPITQPIQPTAIMRRRPATFTQSFFDPVIIYPTQRQIDNATKLIQYDTIINPTNETCPFTCEPFHNQDLVRQILHCGHNFSPSHFNTWFHSNVSCPICRYDIRTYVPQTIINNEELIPTNRENNEVQSIHQPQTQQQQTQQPQTQTHQTQQQTQQQTHQTQQQTQQPQTQTHQPQTPQTPQTPQPQRQRQRQPQPQSESELSSETSQIVNDYLDLLFTSLLTPNTNADTGATNSSTSRNSNSNRLFFEYIIREM